MSNIFDNLGKTAFDNMRVAFGNVATWMPEDEPEIAATVLFKTPTKKHDLGDNDYTSDRPTMEYYQTDFPGLYAIVQDAGTEKIKIEVSAGVFENFVTEHIERNGDGKTILLFLTPVD